MKFLSPLIVVTDLERSKQFYHDVFGLEVILDFGANVTLTGGLALQTKETWLDFIEKKDADLVFQNNTSEYYFEEDDLDAFIQKLTSMHNIRYIHPVKEHAWGQRAVRIYDPDGHILEIGENIEAVVKRFMSQGLSPQETALRMDVPLDYILSCLND